MYEFTMGGAWFKWSLLDATSKRLAAGSFVAAGLAAIPIGVKAGEIGYAAGYRLAAAAVGRAGATPRPGQGASILAEPWMAWVTIVFGIISAVFWWRFSWRQDEMFNRVQNWTLGMAGAWTMAACFVWIAASGAGVAAMPSALALAGVFYVLMIIFWFVAVKRWA